MAHFRYIPIFLVVILLAACSSSEEKTVDENAPKHTAEEYYNIALDGLQSGQYESAIESFREIERQYPFSPWASRAQVMVAYAYYKDSEYDDAIGAIDRFVSLNPGNENVNYMYYLKALSYYERISDIGRDQKITQQAKDALRDVMRRFPQTEFARDARLKLDLVNDHLAGKEMEIGRFYQKQKKYIAAINRFKAVVERFETTSHAPEALYRITETYLALGVLSEAQKNAAVLGHNFPESKWYHYAYRLVEKGADTPIPQGDSWLTRTFTFESTESPAQQNLEQPSFLDRVEEFF